MKKPTPLNRGFIAGTILMLLLIPSEALSTTDLHLQESQGGYFTIHIKKENEFISDFIYSHNGVLDKTVYLPFGAGEYDIITYFEECDRERSLGVAGSRQEFKVTTDSTDILYLHPSCQIQSDSPEIKQLAQEIIRSNNDYGKSQDIHNWMIENISFNYEMANSYQLNRAYNDSLSVLKNKSGVCIGYSNLYAALLRSAGIKTKVVHGFQIDPNETCRRPHAWNQVYVGKWINVDTTWNQFDISDEEFSLHHLPRNYQ